MLLYNIASFNAGKGRNQTAFTHWSSRQFAKSQIKCGRFTASMKLYRPLSRLWECSQTGVQNNKIVLQKRKFPLFCPPVWLHSHRRERGLQTLCYCVCNVSNVIKCNQTNQKQQRLVCKELWIHDDT